MDKIAIVGAGAMGSLFASHLASSVRRLWAYDVWTEHVAAIRERGLCVVRQGAETTVPINATTDPREPGTADAVFLFVKYNQTRRAISDALPMIAPSTVVVTLQNGLGNVEAIREVVPDNRVLYGFTTLTAELLGPGRIEASYAGQGETYVWPHCGRPDRDCDAVVAVLNKGGIATVLAPDIEVMIWKKLIVNCCLNTLCAVTGLSVGDLVAQADSWPVLDGLTTEIVAVARAKGIGLDDAEGRRFLRQVAEEAHAHEPSMLIDVRSGSPTEIGCLNGAVLREGESLGIPTPFNQAIFGVIRVLEETYARRDGAAITGRADPPEAGRESS